VVSRLQTRTERGEHVRLVGRAREHREAAVSDRDDRLARPARRVPAARAVHAAGRAVVEKFGAVVAGETTERPELLEVGVAPDERNGTPVEKQKRDASSRRRPKRGLARGTAN